MYFCRRFEKGCRKAEIKPIEPDAGNAVVGRVFKNFYVASFQQVLKPVEDEVL